MAEQRRQRELPPPVATIGEIAAEVDWIWVYCEVRLPTGASCCHRSAVKLADAIAIFGADASTDAIRRKARCSVCGGKGQSAINLPSFISVTAGWQKYPGP
jgi:hypothetical protein